jgi:FKBP-type peptidyl-prolyl cis-trans isomerase FkpA
MTVTQVPLRPIAKGSLLKLWLAIAALVALAFGLAYMGAGQFKTVTVDTVAAGAGPLIT